MSWETQQFLIIVGVVLFCIGICFLVLAPHTLLSYESMMAFAKRWRMQHRVITDFDDSKEPYLLRWNRRFGKISFKIHAILRADGDRCVHDHPWWFIRIILAGGYTEVYENRKGQLVTQELKVWRPWAPWRIYWCPRDFKHRITKITNGMVSWSFVISGPHWQEWGFFVKRNGVQQKMHYKEFCAMPEGKRIGWCQEDDKS